MGKLTKINSKISSFLLNVQQWDEQSHRSNPNVEIILIEFYVYNGNKFYWMFWALLNRTFKSYKQTMAFEVYTSKGK